MSWWDGEWNKSYIGVYFRVRSQWGLQVCGVETSVYKELVEVGGLWKVTEGALVRRSWIDGSKERTSSPNLPLYPQTLPTHC